MGFMIMLVRLLNGDDVFMWRLMCRLKVVVKSEKFIKLSEKDLRERKIMTTFVQFW
jgi:hypothetical protein